MSFSFFLKRNLNKIPLGIKIGKYIAKLSYKYRPGLISSYSKAVDDIVAFNCSNEELKEVIFVRMKSLVEHAYNNISFYKEHYDNHGFDVSSLKNFDDILNIPIVTKADFKKYDIEQYSFKQTGRCLSNTGGSSGKPFYFYISPQALGHEWAHVHFIWKRLGFNQSMLKLNFAGRSNVNDIVDYDLIRHSLIVDIYSDFSLISDKLQKFILNNDVHFLHGYPSALYEFAVYCENDSILLNKLKGNLKGVFLSSEFPNLRFRNKIEEVFLVPTQSFYGHTERCVMAYETDEKFKFTVLQSYGYAEEVNKQLIGTSYTNYATPLIRYNTEDVLKSSVVEGDILKAFELSEGRNGEFIFDQDMKKIPLTGLVFGRHHNIFNEVEHIQIYQKEPGFALILYTTQKTISPDDAKLLFDSTNVKIKFSFQKIPSAIKTESGKVMLKVREF
jgi:phenylacetate-CoA ligase